MATYLIKTDLAHIKSKVEEFIKTKGFEQVCQKETKGKVKIFAKGRVSKFSGIVSIKWTLKKLREHISVQVNIFPSKLTSLISTICYIILAFLIPVNVWIAHIVILNKPNKSEYLIFPLILFWLSIYPFVVNKFGLEIAKITENSFRNFIGNALRIISPFELKVIPLWVKIIVSSSMFFSFCYLVSIFSHFLVFLILAVSIILFCDIFISRVVKKHPYLKWKETLMDHIFRWTSLNFVVIFFFAVLMIFIIVEFHSYERKKNNIIPINQITKTEGYKEFVSLDYDEIFEFRLRLIKEATYNKTNELENIRWPPRIRDVGISYIRNYFIKPNILITILIFTLTFLALFFLLHLLKAPKDWKSIRVETSFVSIKPPSIAESRFDSSKIFNHAVLFMFFFFGIINYISAVLSLELLSYMVTNKTIFFRETSSLLSWIPTSMALGELDLSYSRETVHLFFTKGFLVGMVSPFILSASVYLRGIYKKAIGIMRTKKEHLILPDDMDSFLKSTCKSLGIETPRILVTQDDNNLVSTSSGLLSKRANIYVEKEILDRLNKNELKAVIVHELSHIKNDLKKIALLKFFSKIALFPNNFLLLLVNYKEMEYNADRLALSVMKNPAYLEDALEKIKKISLNKSIDLYLNSLEKKPKKSKFFTWVQNYKEYRNVFNNFFASDALVGYSHLGIEKRIKTIKGQSDDKI